MEVYLPKDVVFKSLPKILQKFKEGCLVYGKPFLGKSLFGRSLYNVIGNF